MNIAVYCGSASGNRPSFTEGAKALGSWIAQNGHTLVYGGSRTGLMGATADAVLAGGGKVIGVIPDVKLIQERRHPGLTECIETKDMAERKQKMIELADAYVALPGGPGTLDEISEVICLARLGIENKACVLFDTDGYYKDLKKIFEENPEYKIVEAHNGALGVYALHAAKVNHIPVRIFHAHGASITRDWKLPIKLVCKALLPSNMNQHFSCGIEAARCYFGEKVVERNDYELIPNAIEVNRFVFDSTIRNRIRHDNHLENKHIVGHVGRFMSQKNHTFLLDVFAEVSKRDSLAHLVLLGDGELMDAMKEKASNLGIKDRVTFVGNVGNANEWYQAFDCFVLPSVWEGLPVVGVEAQAADLPCIFSSAVTREIGLSDRAKFIPLTEEISTWATEICNALQQNARNDNTKLITEHHYNIEIEAKKLQERYLQLAGEVE